jgi:hypothetical protein
VVVARSRQAKLRAGQFDAAGKKSAVMTTRSRCRKDFEKYLAASPDVPDDTRR